MAKGVLSFGWHGSGIRTIEFKFFLSGFRTIFQSMLRGLTQITTQCSDSKARKSQKAFGALIFDGALHIMPVALPGTCLLAALSRVAAQDGFLAMYEAKQ